MPFRPHSGLVGVFCPDPAYHVHWKDFLHGGSPFDQAVNRLVKLVTEKAGHEVDQELVDAAGVVLELQTGKPASRLAQFIDWALKHPLNPEGRIPHIIRTEAPASVFGNRGQSLTLLERNLNVFGAARVVVGEGHSDCLGVARRHAGQFQTDQYPLQEGFLLRGAQPFIDHLAVEVDRSVIPEGDEIAFHGLYTRFGPTGETLNTTEVITATVTVAA